MESNSQYGGWIHDSPFTSLSVGGRSQDIQDRRNTTLLFKPKPGVDDYNGGTIGLQNATMKSVVGDLPFLNRSKGLKRKRSKGHLALEEESELVLGLGHTGNFSDSGGSAGTRMPSGSMFVKEREDDSSMDLGLGLASSLLGSSCEPILDCVTSPARLITSRGSSAVTSLDSEINMYSQGNPNSCMAPNVYLGFGPIQNGLKDLDCDSFSRKGSVVSSAMSVQNACGTELQLGLSGNSTAVTDSDSFSGVSLGLGPIADMNETRTENVVGVENIPVVDEGSTSARCMKSGGYIPSLLMGPRLDFTNYTNTHEFDTMNKTACPRAATKIVIQEELVSPSPLASVRTSDSTISVSGVSPGFSDRSSKTCKFLGCGKGARGASGLCIAHGGGRRCQKQGCNKGAEGRTVYCKAHGGGRRCQNLGCTKSAEGKTDYCISHGGGRRCSYGGCTKAARGKSGLCIRHGGGKRCQNEGCTKSAEGYSGLCISHGGGKRCQFAGCGKGAQGSTMFCKAHGGGKRCMIQGCNKGAEGSTPLCKGHGGGKRCTFGGGICTKSVHGGTHFCVAHGGGKRCAIEGCTKSARGRTDYCVRHGGGKRCKFEACGKSAQGSTDFCKAHGGGKRCSWGQEGSPYSGEYLKEKTGELFKGPCDRFARGKTGLCAAHSALVQDRRIHGGATLGPPPGVRPGLFQGLASDSMDRGKSNADTKNQVTDCQSVNADDEIVGVEHAKASQYPGVVHGTWSCEQYMAEGENELAFPSVLRPENSAGKGHLLQNLSSDEWDVSSQADRASSPFDRMNLNLSTSLKSSGYWHSFSSPLPQSFAATSSYLMGTANQEGLPTFTSSQWSNHRPTCKVPATTTGTPFLCSLIPPKVLVPPSMQKGNHDISQGKTNTDDVCSMPMSDDGGFDMASLSLTEERVHGGGLMALIAREAGASKNCIQNSNYVNHPVNQDSSEQYMVDSNVTRMRRSCTLGDVGQFLATGVDMN